jgi:hypothetical protein
MLELCERAVEPEHGSVEVRPLLDVAPPEGVPGTGLQSL